MPEVMPDQRHILHIGPHLLEGDLVKGKLFILIDLVLSGKKARGLVVVDFIDVVLLLYDPIDHSLNVVIIFAKPDPDLPLQAQDFPSVKGGVGFIVGFDTFLTDPIVIFSREALSDDSHLIIPFVLPQTAYEVPHGPDSPEMPR
jgi:hypothetical protein